MHRTLWIAAALLVACGGTSDPAPPTCAAGEVAITGTVGDIHYDDRRAANPSVFVNAINSEDGSYQAGSSDGGTFVKLTFHELLIDGHSVPARGFVDLSDNGGPNVGNCETGDLPSTISMDADGNGGTFVLRDLHDSPYCSGASRQGALAGCFHD
jgi:hypothetical protein